jgi:hypothetical protein
LPTMIPSKTLGAMNSIIVEVFECDTLG